MLKFQTIIDQNKNSLSFNSDDKIFYLNLYFAGICHSETRSVLSKDMAKQFCKDLTNQKELSIPKPWLFQVILSWPQNDEEANPDGMKTIETSLEKLKTFETSFHAKVWLPFNFVSQHRPMPLFHVKKTADSSEQAFISSKVRGYFYSRKHFNGIFFKDENRGHIRFKLGKSYTDEFSLRTQSQNLRFRQNTEVTFTIGFTLAGLVLI